ncbi:MAG: hypothetical protein A2Z14_17120 [Chloroflexi bacterium RBG_16_48_8]|nr:MAG: hypothetical protein A2Z14_17120 [Chloroflexi bacterium RBG_16_48_8]
MKESTTKERHIAQLIRLIIWGQILGHLWQVAAVIYQDAPDYFKRTSLGSILLPILIVMAMHVFKLDLLFAKVDPGWLFIALGLVLFSSLTAIAFRNVRFYLDLPKSLITPAWRYGQITSIVVLIVYGKGLMLTGWFSIRILRTGENTL